MRYIRIKPLFIIIVLCMGVVVSLIVYLVHTPTWTNTYLLPRGFTGWIEVIYDQKGQPTLVQDSNGYVIKVPNTGLVKTSSPPPKGKTGTDILYYVDQNGKRTEVSGDSIRGGGTGSGEIYNSDGTTTQLPYKETIFIGTEEEWDNPPKLPEFK